MALDAVPFGRYAGCTLAELQTRLATLKTAALNTAPGQGGITGGSVNGKSFTYDMRFVRTIEAEIAEIQEAILWLDDDAVAPSDTQTIVCR